jgi:AraC-like DNA-binding protein
MSAARALLHGRPSDPWTIAELAGKVGVSRSVLAERFRHFLGVPPITYLTRSRLQLGAQMLTSTSHSVPQIAVEVGYDSEPAFNRAFKREFGTPPARFAPLQGNLWFAVIRTQLQEIRIQHIRQLRTYMNLRSWPPWKKHFDGMSLESPNLCWIRELWTPQRLSPGLALGFFRFGRRLGPLVP